MGGNDIMNLKRDLSLSYKLNINLAYILRL